MEIKNAAVGRGKSTTAPLTPGLIATTSACARARKEMLPNTPADLVPKNIFGLLVACCDSFTPAVVPYRAAVQCQTLDTKRSCERFIPPPP